MGLEAANGLMKRGMDVTVVHIGPWLMERQLDEPAARLLQKSLEEKGMKFLLQKQTAELVKGESGRVAAIKFKDGDSAPADLVVMAVGIRPNTELAESAGLHCNRGIVVNDTMQTFDPRIYSIGECAAHRGIAYGLVAPLFEQAKVCANHLAHYGIGRYQGSVTSTKLKVTGIDLFSAGDFIGGEGTEAILYSDPIGGVYKKLVIKDNKLVGGVMYGDTVDGAWYFSLLRDGKDVVRAARPPDVRPGPLRQPRPPGHQQGRDHDRRHGSVRLQRRVQGRHRQGDPREGPVHAGGRAEAHQGIVVVRFVHRPGRADPGRHRGRRLFRRAEDEIDVRLHRPHPRSGARRDPPEQAADDPAGA